MTRTKAVDPDRRIASVATALGLQQPELTTLPGGGANRTLRMRDPDNDLVLRLAGDAGESLGASRESECVMQALAAAAGLAPAIVWSRPAEGLVVARHVGGRIPDPADLQDPAFLARIGAWLARLHALAPPPLPAVDFGARAAGYLAQLQARSPSGPVVRLAAQLARRRAALPPAPRLVCCHHDLHRRNILDDGQSLCVVDWEYAGPGDAAADLAACLGYHEPGPEGRAALLNGYGADSPALRERIAALGWIFDCLWYGWNGVAALEGVAVDAALQSRLMARLQA